MSRALDICLLLITLAVIILPLTLTGLSVAAVGPQTDDTLDAANIAQAYDPYRMRNWAICEDGAQIYTKNPEMPFDEPLAYPCDTHGGVRAFGPGETR